MSHPDDRPPDRLITDVIAALDDLEQQGWCLLWPADPMLSAPPYTGVARTPREELEYWWALCSDEERQAFLKWTYFGRA